MFDKVALSKKTVKELQGIADENKIVYNSKAKKDDLIKLILQVDKVSSDAKQKKDNLNGVSSSGISASSNAPKTENKSHFFNNIPELPHVYGKNKIIFLVRDPHWGFVYWEITENLSRQFGLDGADRYLRIYDISDSDNPENAGSYFDVKLTMSADNWYIKFPQSNRSYIVDYGIFRDGKFVTVMRSNKVYAPREDVSDQLDQEWMISGDLFNSILKASGAGSLFERVGSQELMKFISGNVSEENGLSSAGVTSGGIAASGKKVR